MHKIINIKSVNAHQTTTRQLSVSGVQVSNIFPKTFFSSDNQTQSICISEGFRGFASD